MAVRVTQVTAEVLIEPIPTVRVTQVVAEVLIAPVDTNLLVTQIAAEVLIQPPTAALPGDACAPSWTFPAPNAFPFPLRGGPQYTRFQEIKPEWGEFGHNFPDKVPDYNTIQTAKIRYFEIDYAGLDQAQAKILDDHYKSTRGGVSFSATLPRSGEVITGLRYEEYKVIPHTKIWNQSRSVRFVKYTN